MLLSLDLNKLTKFCYFIFLPYNHYNNTDGKEKAT